MKRTAQLIDAQNAVRRACVGNRRQRRVNISAEETNLL